MALKYSLLLEAIDKISAPAKRVQASIKGLTAAARKGARDLAAGANASDKMARSVEHLDRRARRLRQIAIGSVGRPISQTMGAAANKARELSNRLATLPARLKLVERAGQGMGKLARNLGSAALSAAKWGAAASVAAAGWAVFDLFKVASQFEQFSIQLEGTEGSAAKAKAAMAWVQKFATQTPYELDQVMAAYVQLRAYGIDPTDGALRTLGDTAAGMNKDLMQAVEALADAQTGEFERLKEFAIRSKVAGDSVTFSYEKNGKTIQKVAKNNSAAIRASLLGIMDDRFGGGMARQAKSFSGIIANLKDKWSEFQMKIANAGIFDKVKAKAEQFLAKIDVMSKDGRLDNRAKKISDSLGVMFDRAIDFIEKTDWQSVADGMGAIVSVLMTIIEKIGAAASAWNRWQTNIAINKAQGVADGWFTSKDAKAGARRDLFILRGMKAEQEGKTGAGSSGKPRGKPTDLSRKWAPSLSRPQSNATPARPRIPGSAAAQKVAVSGKTEIDIRYSGPISARATTRQTGDVPVRTNIGKIMSGAA